MAKSYGHDSDRFEHRRKAAVKHARKSAQEKREDRRNRHWKNIDIGDATWMPDGEWF